MVGFEVGLPLPKSHTGIAILPQHSPSSTYDRLFHVKTGYQSKLHRDDREHTVGLDVHGEVSFNREFAKHTYAT